MVLFRPQPRRPVRLDGSHGVPVAFVESSLRGSLIAMLLGIAGTGVLAITLIIVFGRRIERPVRRLAELARSLGRFDSSP